MHLYWYGRTQMVEIRLMIKKNDSWRERRKAYLEEFDDVAGAEDAVGDEEFEGIGGGEIRGEKALVDAAAAENLAGGARTEDDRRSKGVERG